MRRANEITIDADIVTIYGLGSRIERWPDLLPHYRKVDVLWSDVDGSRLVARMSATRDGIPVSWMCWLARDAVARRLTFRHIGGFTRGMQVVWTFEQLPDGRVTVRIIHEFRKGWPIMALDRFVTDRVVGEFFIHHIAGKTLAMVKLLAEAERLAAAEAPA